MSETSWHYYVRQRRKWDLPNSKSTDPTENAAVSEVLAAIWPPLCLVLRARDAALRNLPHLQGLPLRQVTLTLTFELGASKRTLGERPATSTNHKAAEITELMG